MAKCCGGGGSSMECVVGVGFDVRGDDVFEIATVGTENGGVG